MADVKRPGKDVTLVAVGLMVPRALEAAEKLAAEGIDVEVIDPRTIAPLDKDTIFNSIRKTHRAAVVEESNKTAGIGAELAAMFQEELYDELDGLWPASRRWMFPCPTTSPWNTTPSPMRTVSARPSGP